MSFINKNIWSTFYFVLFLWTVISAAAAQYVYMEVYDDIVKEQRSVTAITANSLTSSFEQYETIIDIVGDELSRLGAYKYSTSSGAILQSVADLDDAILAVSLYGVTGNLYAGALGNSRNTKDAKILSDLEAMSADEISAAVGPVLGRTQYSEPLEEIVIPFRKAIRNDEGDVLFILSLYVSLKEGFDYFVKNVHQANFVNSFLYREQDRYFQLAPVDNVYDPKIYHYQIPEAEVEQSIAKLEHRYGKEYDKIKQSGSVFINELEHPSRQSLSASLFLPNYGLWLTSETKLDVVNDCFIRQVAAIISLYLLASVLIYMMFGNISRSEKEKKQDLTFQANHDYLTGLHNRFYLERQLAALKPGQPQSLIRIDLDNFRSINKQYGDTAGDAILSDVSQRLNKLRLIDERIIRSDGDEFIILTPETNQRTLLARCEDIKRVISVPYRYKDIDVVVTCCISVSMTNESTRDGSALIRNSDLAMSIAKREHNKIVVYQDALLEDFKQNNLLEIELKKALRRNELYMVYQPQLDSNDKVKGVEALLRWNSASLGMVPPDKFIPIAEKCGLMGEIGRFVIEQSLSDIASLNHNVGESIDLSINVSIKQFRDEQFVEQLKLALDKHQFPAQSLILEATESVFIDDIDAVMLTMKEIKELGVSLSLDDFGTGYSSLSLLKALPIDEVKIDKSFVFDMMADQDSHSMVESIILLAHKLNMKSVAEGVETREMNQSLVELGCDFYQGYLHSKPLDFEALSDYLNK
ncbi:putative bifunctional diguanylate cyclase/phosphodiesterase [Vibrio europaeus]|uniref:putative bifunctional diguanylate cyclase/phosphodiesterase n=1 Tax=Vibrio europaeus TaxID=300876 RepID=UPI00148DCDE7|nr:bifunctional diguanylate cyclase/phosphodiesterase [Vibrio europaeus]NOH23926.1 bifunctional diguanylate cyclase/phosphodiesterase [Vibrio europaeus]